VATQSQHNLLNETFLDDLDNGREKVAMDLVNDFTRTRMREDGFMRRMMPPVPISNDQLDRQLDTDKPTKIVDKEPDSPAAITVPFGTSPTGVYIRGPKYRVNFDRIMSPRFTKDVDELRTYTMDIRQILSDNSIKDMLAEEDTKFIYAFNAAIGSGPDVVVPWAGVPQWKTITGGVTRETLFDALKIMPSTDAHLETEHIMCNNIFVKEVCKFARDEAGGDWAQDILKDGWSSQKFLGKEWTVTIKRGLVGDNTIFMTADAKFIGKHYTLEDTVMYVKKDMFMIEWVAYQSSGCTLGHSAGLARCDFV
jgi:hypothetical protein